MPEEPLTPPPETPVPEDSEIILDSDLNQILRRKAWHRVTFLIFWIAFVGFATVVGCYYLKLFFPSLGTPLFTIVLGSVTAVVLVFAYDARNMVHREVNEAASFLHRPFTAYEARSRYPSFFVVILGQRTRLHLYAGRPHKYEVMGKVYSRHPDSSYEFNPEEAQALYDCLVNSDKPELRKAAGYIAKRD
jgi:hypothetical protein